MIALDWGSSQLRAFHLGEGGAVLAQRSSDDGASRLAGGAPAFEAALQRLAGDWLQPGATVLACGMVGSAHGWREAAYLPCPVALDGLHRQLVTVAFAGGTLAIVPGLATRGADGAPDVMRGEETQLAGLLHAEPALAADACVVMPGTHSKWVDLRAGRVQGFATRMTGELYALLREHSVLARLMAPAEAFDGDAFDRGVAIAREAGGADLARLLFGLRARGLFGELAPAGAADALSGLLIGAEIAAARPGARPLVLVGEPALCGRYARAFAAWGVTPQVHTAPLAARGLWAIAHAPG